MKIPATPPSFGQLIQANSGPVLSKILGKQIGPDVDGVYEHWDHLRHLTPPTGLTVEQWWLAIRFARLSMARSLPLLDKEHEEFRVSITSAMQRKLHFIDREAAGAIMGVDDVDPDTIKRRYLMRSLIEEAMTSSQLEGASTTTQVAKEMLSTGRQPRDRSEQMIFNNFAMMQDLQKRSDRQLTPDMIFEMHRTLMRDAMDDPSQTGRLRTSQDNVIVQDKGDPTITLHVPPPASELPERLQRLCDFANATDDGNFLHPVVRAIAIHFHVGYDHPFCDGNGRTARALFYWSMLRSGYWLTQFISISSVLKKAPGQYVRSYLYSETDSSDMSYFTSHQLGVIEQAVNSLRQYLARKAKERRQAESLLRPGSSIGALLNHRQRALLLNAVRHPDSAYDISGHQSSHRVTYPTARADLLGLEGLGLLAKIRRGKAFLFVPAPDLAKRLERDGGPVSK